MLDQTARAARIEGGVRLIETSAASGPLAFGIWRRYVAFPRDFAERYDADERNLALPHELGHHARGDLIANWVALVGARAALVQPDRLARLSRFPRRPGNGQ